MGELTQALLKARRYDAIGRIYTKNVIDELGDVMLCLDQLRYKICRDTLFSDMLRKRIAEKLVYMKEVARGEKK
jgi:NTP pyrophosphatase (non-canonical NTP hydrolase)